MASPAAEFVERVRVALGAANANQLADKLGLGAAGGQRVGRWLKGENEPDYEATMLLLATVGWLNMPESDEGDSEIQPLPRSSLRALEAKVDQVAKTTADSLSRLEVGIAQLSERLPLQARPGQGAGQ